ncbi:MAG TPA: hypothetical protein VGB71_04800 [Flavisolibacter sp.]|jgi:hypothetical protein
MTKQCNAIQPVPPIETWKEELSRSGKYKEATQKRQEEKQMRKAVGDASKINPAGQQRTGS